MLAATHGLVILAEDGSCHSIRRLNHLPGVHSRLLQTFVEAHAQIIKLLRQFENVLIAMETLSASVVELLH